MGAAASAGVGGEGAEGAEGAEGGQSTPDCYFCHMCRHSFEFLPGPQSDGRDSQAPDICTACGSDAVEMVRRGGRGGSMMPATDTLHQLVMASDGAISGPELLMNMLAFSGHGLFGPDPEERAMQESFDSSADGKNRPTPEDVREKLPERPLGLGVLAREPDCVICGDEFCLGGAATSLPCAHHFVRSNALTRTHTRCPPCRTVTAHRAARGPVLTVLSRPRAYVCSTRRVSCRGWKSIPLARCAGSSSSTTTAAFRHLRNDDRLAAEAPQREPVSQSQSRSRSRSRSRCQSRC